MAEPWDASREKAKELRLEQWGNPEEVAAMSAPIRWANTRKEATAILKEIASHSPLTGRSGITAQLQVPLLNLLAALPFIPHSALKPITLRPPT
jgi:hypothetical protein